jgi:protein-L-isoaspartate(D-aspartate) O-methyltransferase
MITVDDRKAALRRQMVSRLKRAGVLITPAVQEAMGSVPRDLFVPQVEVQSAYLDHAVMVKHGNDGSPISSASQPTIVAIMLEQLQVRPGHRVLEIGTGTGYNAALLAALVGDGGYLVSIELEPDLAERAGDLLSRLGYAVEVVVGDGREGYSQQAPYDRVIVTTGAYEVARPWSTQLVNGGRMVVPIVDHHGVGSIVVFEKAGGELVRGAEIPCAFLPIRDTAN